MRYVLYCVVISSSIFCVRLYNSHGTCIYFSFLFFFLTTSLLFLVFDRISHSESTE